MEKKVYELKIDAEFEHTLPASSDAEIEGLTKQLIDEGCRDALVTWDGVILDGHNRYRICHENNIPFTYIEKEFVNRDQAKLWIISTQMGRRNLTDYAKCELVLPLEPGLKEAAEQTRRAKISEYQKKGETGSNLNPSREKALDTLDTLANAAGVSRGTMHMAKKIFNSGDEGIKELVRNGKMSIYRAFTKIKGENSKAHEDPDKSETLDTVAQPTQPEVAETQAQPSPPEPPRNKLIPREVPLEPVNTDVFPGYGLVVPVKPEPYERPSDDVYNIPPINVCGIIPADNLELREKVEITHVSSELRTATEYYVRRSGEIMRGLSEASINDGNIEFLKSIVTEGYETIIQFLNSIQYGGTYDECEEN